MHTSRIIFKKIKCKLIDVYISSFVYIINRDHFLYFVIDKPRVKTTCSGGFHTCLRQSKLFTASSNRTTLPLFYLTGNAFWLIWNMNFFDPDIRCLMIVERERVSLVAFYYIEGFIWRGGGVIDFCAGRNISHMFNILRTQKNERFIITWKIVRARMGRMLMITRYRDSSPVWFSYLCIRCVQAFLTMVSHLWD